MSQPDLLATGIYTISDAAELIQAPRDLVRIWVAGRGDKQSPVIENELGRLDNKIAISFNALMELRFVALFHNAGVKLREIRAIMDEVRDTLEHPHPFATKTVFKTDGRKIVAEIARRNGVANIYDLRSHNYEMHPVVMKSLKDDVIYDPHGIAIEWRPRPKIAPNVIVHPAFSFGQPILKASQIPTEAIYGSFKAEKSARAVSLIYEVPEKRVREAVRFEQELRRAA